MQRKIANGPPKTKHQMRIPSRRIFCDIIKRLFEGYLRRTKCSRDHGLVWQEIWQMSCGVYPILGEEEVRRFVQELSQKLAPLGCTRSLGSIS